MTNTHAAPLANGAPQTLTAKKVEALMKQCLAPKQDGEGVTVVEGIVGRFAFDSEKIRTYSVDIHALLYELPDEFRIEKGGGWTFLNACNDRHGAQWTGLHSVMEHLFCLGIAAGFAKWLLPRDMWDVLPGGMPYVATLMNQTDTRP